MELLLLPLLTGILICLWKNPIYKYLALGSAAVCLAITAGMIPQIMSGETIININLKWFSTIKFAMQMDGLSLMLCLLSQIVILGLFLFYFNQDHKNNNILWGLALLMQVGLNGVFMARDAMMFYIFWEVTLIPIYFIVLKWGEGENIAYVSNRFFIFTFIGSLFMLASILYLASKSSYSFLYTDLVAVSLTEKESIWVALGLLLGFGVKIPIFPLHTWQASTYTQAPNFGSILLSAIMLKMGLYGLLKWLLPLVPESFFVLQPYFLVLCSVGVLYGAYLAFTHTDLKKIIAYSSLSHVNMIALAIFTQSSIAAKGAGLQMFAHGINIMALFWIVQIIEHSAQTRNIFALGGIATQAKKLAVVFMVVMLASIAVPLTNGFPGEFLMLKGIFDKNAIIAVLVGLSVIFSAVYMLRAYQHTMFGTASGGIYLFQDVKIIQMLAFAICIVLILWAGIQPQALLDIFEKTVIQILNTVEETRGIVS